jgi:hypothetical protein
LSEVVPSCKTSDGGVDGHDISEGVVHEMELSRGPPCGPALHPQQSASHKNGSKGFMITIKWDKRLCKLFFKCTTTKHYV